MSKKRPRLWLERAYDLKFSSRWRRVAMMNRTRAPVYLLLLCVFAFSLFTGLLNASTTSLGLNWWVIGSGGSRITTGGTVLQSTIGQPLAYRAGSGAVELCAGFWCGTAGEYEVFLPAILNQSSTGWPGPAEVEPNGGYTQANGPICSDVSYTGVLTPGDTGQDWFYLEKPAGGRINIAEVALPHGSGLTFP
jgi:hypothetical protein